jgi:hypothetical protein
MQTIEEAEAKRLLSLLNIYNNAVYLNLRGNKPIDVGYILAALKKNNLFIHACDCWSYARLHGPSSTKIKMRTQCTIWTHFLRNHVSWLSLGQCKRYMKAAQLQEQINPKTDGTSTPPFSSVTFADYFSKMKGYEVLIWIKANQLATFYNQDITKKHVLEAFQKIKEQPC